jgi:UDP-N-acetylglucosamine--N-acetylmuramyl-(pentapeptide) pyrophosphoryl-undecaprenol N-acetylglucosamine transferase
MEEEKIKVVIAGGGTGGHVFPGLALAKALNPQNVVWIGLENGFEKKQAEQAGILFYSIKASPLVGKAFFKKIFNLARLAFGFFQAFFSLLKIKPSVVVGTGGYVSAPVLLSSLILRIPTLILEQNVLPGRTTRFFAPFVSCVLASFEDTKVYLPKAKVAVTGNPVRREIGQWGKVEACEKLGLSAQKLTLLVMGASQGAQALNRVLLQALPFLAKENWQVLHLTGKTHYEKVIEESQKVLSGISMVYKPFAFVEEMGVFYSACDLVVARAGATSLAEIMQAGKPSLLIPYPYAADNHQEINARWLEKKGGCMVVLEKELTANLLYEKLKQLLGNREALEEMGKKAKEASCHDALERILAIVKEVAQRGKFFG